MIEKQARQSTSGTSFDEQTIFFYIKQIFPDAINRGKYSFVENENIELDIYIPSLHFAIEYDGAHWHKNKSEKDNYKNFILSEAGAYLIRIRECGLDDLENNYGETIYRTVSSTDNGLHLHEVVNKVVEIIKEHIEQEKLNIEQETVALLDNFYLDAATLIEDRPNIYAQYITTYQTDNITKTCLIKFWDFEKNGNLMPDNVSIKANIFVVLTCPCGHSFHIQPSLFKLNINQEEKECKQCMLKHCPAIFKYPAICDIQKCNVYNELISTLKYIPIE